MTPRKVNKPFPLPIYDHWPRSLSTDMSVVDANNLLPRVQRSLPL